MLRTFAPIVASATSVLADVEVLRVVEIGVKSVLDAMDHAGLQVDQKRPRDVVLIVCLVKEHILSIVPLRRILLQHTISADPMLRAQLLPKLVSD